MNITPTTASYIRLRDNSWGLRIVRGTYIGDDGVDRTPALRGDELVTVTKKDGTTKDEIVGEIVGTFTSPEGRRGYLATIGRGSLGAYRVTRDDNR